MSQDQHLLTDPERVLGHIGGAGSLLGTLVGLLPSIAGLIAIVWYLLVIYESRTLQQFLRKRFPNLALDGPPTFTEKPHVHHP